MTLVDIVNRFVFFISCAALLAGCVGADIKLKYNDVTPKITFETHAKIAVGVHDRRSYVISGEKDPTFVGLNRNGMGVPFDVKTKSGLPLAREFQNSLTSALSQAGATVIRVDLGTEISGPDAQRLMLGAGADKALLVTIYEWRSDGYANVNLRYEILVSVVGVTAKRLAGDKSIGQVLGSEYPTPGYLSEALVPPAYKEKLEEMLSDPAIVSALQ
jgi:hypothetical protein